MIAIKTFAVALLLILVIGSGAYFAFGLAPLWRRIAGPPDQGAISFETLERRSMPNDALACHPAFCTAKIDVVSPVLDIPAAALRDRFQSRIGSEPKVEMVAADDATLTYRFIQRSLVMQFPDTVVVQFRDLPNGQSTLLIYSRSQLGRSDLGANLDRVRRWLALVESS